MKLLLLALVCINALNARCLLNTKAYHEGEAGARFVFFRESSVYAKRWALAYCLGYSSNENKMLKTDCGDIKEVGNPMHIDNMLEDNLGKEALQSISAFIDENDHWRMWNGRVNGCFHLIYYSKDFNEMLENTIKQHCERCKPNEP